MEDEGGVLFVNGGMNGLRIRDERLSALLVGYSFSTIHYSLFTTQNAKRMNR